MLVDFHGKQKCIQDADYITIIYINIIIKKDRSFPTRHGSEMTRSIKQIISHKERKRLR